MSHASRADGPPAPAESVAITFDGAPIVARRGESLAAALTAAGIHPLRETHSGARRGLFCGMGVCQECLVEIDGRAGERACMTKVQAAMAVRRQGARAALAECHAELRDQTLRPDILVIGAGAAGLNAATAAARAGAEVLIADERARAGGQFFKQPAHTDVRFDDRQFQAGRVLIEQAEALGIRWLREALVWGAFLPLELMIRTDEGGILCKPKRVIVATGAYERPLPVPGWTLPGVMTTGAAQTLLRSYRVLPGRRVLIAGNGPLNLQVASELARAGAELAAVAELAPRPGPRNTAALAAMAWHDPALTRQGVRFLRDLRRRRIPVLHGAALRSVTMEPSGLLATVASPERGFAVDVVCMGYGFWPANELLRALGCAADGERIRIDENGATSVPHVYAAGDCVALGGAPTAQAEGTIAGIAAAASLGLAVDRDLLDRARRNLARHRRFQKGLWSLYAADRPAIAPDTIVCRCEELRWSAVESAIDAGCGDLNAVKRLTRLGMGRCQGRYCVPLAAERLGFDAAHTPRPPAKPVRISDIG